MSAELHTTIPIEPPIEVTLAHPPEPRMETRLIVDAGPSDYAGRVALSVEAPEVTASPEDARLAEVFAVPPESAGRGRRVTPETEADATDWLAKAVTTDHELATLLGGKGLDIGAVTEVRTDPDLRKRVGSHFLDKLNALAEAKKLPERVQSNRDLKTPNSSGYSGKYTNREYAALMALSYIDGTFSRQLEGSDVVTYDKKGEVDLGQHRAAAQMVLQTPAAHN